MLPKEESPQVVLNIIPRILYKSSTILELGTNTSYSVRKRADSGDDHALQRRHGFSAPEISSLKYKLQLSPVRDIL